MTGDDNDFLREFIQTFLQDVDSKLPLLEKHLDYFNGPELKNTAHSFAGTASCLGAPDFYQATVALETAALSGAREEASLAQQHFLAELEKVRTYLESYLESLN